MHLIIQSSHSCDADRLKKQWFLIQQTQMHVPRKELSKSLYLPSILVYYNRWCFRRSEGRYETSQKTFSDKQKENICCWNMYGYLIFPVHTLGTPYLFVVQERRYILSHRIQEAGSLEVHHGWNGCGTWACLVIFIWLPTMAMMKSYQLCFRHFKAAFRTHLFSILLAFALQR